MGIESINTQKEFCRFFGITENQLRNYRNNRDALIRKIHLPKRNGGFRIVYVIIDDGFRDFIKQINRKLYNDYAPPKCVHGFVKTRSIVSNAACHLKKRVIINADIKNFFESIDKNSVQSVFTRIGFKKKYAIILSDLLTKDGKIITGFSVSPTIANMVCLEMDYGFMKLADSYGAVYTRYADDITISTDELIPNKIEIVNLLSEYGFSVNEEKYKISRRGGNQYVTGLTVCDERPRLSRKLKRSLRLELYYIKKFGFSQHFIHNASKYRFSNFSRLMHKEYGVDGYVSFINSIEPQFARFIRKQLDEIEETNR